MFGEGEVQQVWASECAGRACGSSRLVASAAAGGTGSQDTS